MQQWINIVQRNNRSIYFAMILQNEKTISLKCNAIHVSNISIWHLPHLVENLNSHNNEIFGIQKFHYSIRNRSDSHIKEFETLVPL